ncbi:L-methionine (R)-S-oxide reductase [Entomortierella parvispora]|uniref:L-methionine (R)-S-oxide reductase n=1 Tax=Entomortierella parvispora TaxID=205924 RepID=A0A9P3M0S4_9FUNG|nr:L-methionine (R)-S-oxide reductase [Entomortierella parvispora]
MTPNITASTASDKAEFYQDLELQIQGVVDGQRNWITNLANASALIYHGLRAVTNKPINWAGFYVLDQTTESLATDSTTGQRKDALILGPFQGKVACTNIAFGRGVCGTAAAEKRTLLVKDVHEFPGHIACDSASNSEIVVPLVLNERVIGVLDLDCEVTEGFDEVDQAGLEVVAKILVEACDWRGVV